MSKRNFLLGKASVSLRTLSSAQAALRRQRRTHSPKRAPVLCRSWFPPSKLLKRYRMMRARKIKPLWLSRSTRNTSRSPTFPTTF